ncbi:MAG: flagellar export chaperone FliS [Dissulfurimicrobium sp.]|uniref:flagellar export chaperone FliS n=1 Tax=Dissulfurimicrobium sp. TaxID=2022436 RepID=UPI00404AE29F
MQNIYKTYEKTDILSTDPYKLILLLYDASLKNLYKAREGLRAKDPVMRGEGLSKAIAIITELLSAVQGENAVAGFLRGLYSAILVELPKINLTNDEKTLNTAIKYMAQLRHIWQTEVMPNVQRSGNGGGNKDLAGKEMIPPGAGDSARTGGKTQPPYTLSGGHQRQAGMAAYTYSFSCRG